MDYLIDRKIAVVIVQPKNYPHSAAFSEIAETAFYGLKMLGHKATIRANEFIDDGLNIVFGAHLLTPAQAAKLPQKSIIYNLEQIDPSSQWSGIKSLLGRHPVWDYSLRNIKMLTEMGYGDGVFHVPVGYVPEMTRIATASEEDIDVLFYGSVNERRKAVLDALVKEGLKVEALFGVYGAVRDTYIARAKVVLNLHYYESSIFELVRVSYLLANRKAVVAECHENTETDPDLEGAFAAARYGGLVRECKALVNDSEKRKALEGTAFEKFSGRDEAAH